MSFFNTFLLLSKLGSKIGNVEIDKKFLIDIKSLRQTNNRTFVNHLPEFDNNKNHIIANGKKVLTGAILKRPLDIIELISSRKPEFHYAVVLGTSQRGEEILIEMAKGTNINLVTKNGFLVERFNENQIEIHFNPKTEISREQIIERAKKFQFDDYDLLDLNCKVFVEYLIFDIVPPKRKLELKKFQLQLCDITISMLKLQLSEPSNDKYKDFLNKEIKDTEKDKKRLLHSIEELKKKSDE